MDSLTQFSQDRDQSPFFVGRHHERRLLADAIGGPEAEFVVLYGRRRVGKTYLVRQVLGDTALFTYTGATNLKGQAQLAEFTKALRAQGWLGTGPVRNWFDAFAALRQLIEQAGRSRPAVVFIDEMPWMDSKKSDFLPAFEHFWNGWASGVGHLTLIVCGSAASWLTQKVFRNKGGLYNRVTRQIPLQPFTLAECRDYFDARGIVWSLHDMVCSYMIFGGIPYYLRLFDPRLSLSLNVDTLCFGPTAPLSQEFNQLFSTLFAHPYRHQQVVRVLAARQQGSTREDVATKVDFPDGGSLTKVLQELEQSGFLRHYQPYGRQRNGGLWQLTDPFTAFHLRFMEAGHGEGYWSQSAGHSRQRAWSGLAFEQVCLAHSPQIRQALGVSGVAADLSGWRSRPSTAPGAQVDLVIDRADGVINLCEMKYTAGEFQVDAATERALRTKVETFRQQTGTRKALHLTLVTTYGLAPGSHAGVFQHAVTMHDLVRR
ncbi:MAG: ATP-binding protein [Bifidobacteriaceae bacterium]|jgi:hypothetical protein|nr:ATP-binding protein [Bifidobacteriaceae bacterium]